jgi:hypothetical protein
MRKKKKKKKRKKKEKNMDGGDEMVTPFRQKGVDRMVRNETQSTMFMSLFLPS